MMRNTLPPLASNDLLCRAVRYRGLHSAEADDMRTFPKSERRVRNKRVVRYVRPIHQSKLREKRFASNNLQWPAHKRHAQVFFLRHAVNEHRLSLIWVTDNNVWSILAA